MCDDFADWFYQLKLMAGCYWTGGVPAAGQAIQKGGAHAGCADSRRQVADDAWLPAREWGLREALGEFRNDFGAINGDGL